MMMVHAANGNLILNEFCQRDRSGIASGRKSHAVVTMRRSGNEVGLAGRSALTRDRCAQIEPVRESQVIAPLQQVTLSSNRSPRHGDYVICQRDSLDEWTLNHDDIERLHVTQWRLAVISNTHQKVIRVSGVCIH